MFIREIKKKNPNSDKIFAYHRLVESVRTPNGPRQHVVLELGKLDLHKEQWKELANRIEQIISGQKPLFPPRENIESLAQHYAKLLIKKRLSSSFKHTESESRLVEKIYVDDIASHDLRSLGPEYVGLSALKGLKLDSYLYELGLTPVQVHLVTLLIVGRLIHPSSELELKRYAQEQSALDELLGTDFSHIAQNALYRASDLLFLHKDKIENFLVQQAREVFSLSETIILYDLTNTYFEGEVKSYKKAKWGRSKDKRNDRPLTTLGLVLDEQGFVKGSSIFKGNVSEPSTLLEVIQSIHDQVKCHQPSLFQTKPTVVLDAGIATNDNLILLKSKGFSYVVVSRSKPEQWSEDNLVKIKKDIQAEVIHRQDELFLRCISQGKLKKERSIIEKSRDKMQAELKKLHEGLSKKGTTKVYAKILERIGRLRERYPRVSSGFEIHVKEQDKKAVAVTWRYVESKLGKPYDGSYYLRTDRTELSPKQIWSVYIMLTNVEDAFRCLKDELGIRPVHHNKENRIEGHLFITVLAYHLICYIQNYLKKKGIHHRWKTIRSWLYTHQMMTTTMPKQKGGAISIRYSTMPTFKQKEIYKALKITPYPIKRKKITT